MKRDIFWFKENIAPILEGFKIEYSFFKNGDFGNLHRAEFENKEKGGNIDFWEKDWLEIHIYDYQNDKELMHILLEPEQGSEKEKAIEKMQHLLCRTLNR